GPWLRYAERRTVRACSETVVKWLAPPPQGNCFELIALFPTHRACARDCPRPAIARAQTPRCRTCAYLPLSDRRDVARSRHQPARAAAARAALRSRRQASLFRRHLLRRVRHSCRAALGPSFDGLRFRTQNREFKPAKLEHSASCCERMEFGESSWIEESTDGRRGGAKAEH